MTLTNHQIDALEFLNSPDQFLVLSGSAGVGKTTVLAEFCKRNFDIQATAPTHKAVKVISDKINRNTSTIHSFLKLDRVLASYGAYEYKFNLSKVVPTKCLIVDESSMLDEFLLDCIIKTGIKTIFVGDNKQVKPVGFNYSPIFSKGFKTFELTEIIRQADGNDIVDLSRNLSWIYEQRSGKNFTFFKDGDIPMDLIIESNGADKCKFITWTNEVVRSVNNAVRHMIYTNPAQIELGETLLFNEPYKSLYKNSEEIIVTSVTDSHIYYNEANVPNPYINTFLVNSNIQICSDLDLKKMTANLNHLKQEAIYKTISWKKYYDYLESFAQVQYNHAITVHKSQGSTYDNAIINTSDILKNRDKIERDSLLYTAITRAKHQNFLI